jgi:hypothetical protein
MAQVTLDNKEISGALLSLLNRLAQAICWVCRKRGKVTFDVPDRLSPSPKVGPLIHCLAPVSPLERAEAEILLGILKKMGKKAAQRPKSKQRK